MITLSSRGALALASLEFGRMETDELKSLVTDVVFGMASGEHGIPEWLRDAESELASREHGAAKQCPNCRGKNSSRWPLGPCTVCHGTGFAIEQASKAGAS